MPNIPNLDRIITIATMKSVLEPLGLLAKDVVVKRVKSGYGLSPGFSKVKLKALSNSYKEWRSGKAVYFQKGGSRIRISKEKWRSISEPVLGEFGSPSRSNLTLTGQLLESIQSRINDSGKVELFIPDTVRKGIRLKNGKIIPNRARVTNAQVAKYVQEQGRDFFNFTDGEIRILTDEYQKLINEAIERFNF